MKERSDSARSPSQSNRNTQSLRNDQELADLFSLAIDGAMDQDTFAKLQDRLQSDPEARKHYIRHRLLEAGMARELSVDAIGGMVDQIGFAPGAKAVEQDDLMQSACSRAVSAAADSAEIASSQAVADSLVGVATGQGNPCQEGPRGTQWISWIGQHAAVIVPWVLLVGGCLAVMFGLQAHSSFDDFKVVLPSQVGVASVEHSVSQVTAMLVDEAGAKFAGDRSTDDVVFNPGDYELLEGTVHLRFASGADLVLQAPAKLRIDDKLHTRLAFGAVRAIVPPSAIGFTVATTDVNFEDVGTEFGLSVSKKTGESTMQVFDGQVNVRESKSNDLMKSVHEGGWVRYADGKSKQGDEPDASQFPSPGEIGFLRWKSIQQQHVDDPSLIGWFPFTKQADQQTLVNAVASSPVTSGRISGPRWVSGRWDGKDALLFDRDTDFVEFEIPGKYQELTIAVWMQVDRLDREMISICNSNEGDDGDLHFQMNRYGLPRGGIMAAPRESFEWVGNPVPVGKWVHVVSVTSLTQRRSDIYINGKRVMKSELAEGDYPIEPGVCRLGNWLSFGQYLGRPARVLNGRMDEVAIWSRALKDDEISKLVDEGRPSLVWSSENPALEHPLPSPKPY
ncbi:LamG-like jellyroll fold domain-containing protein [Neorhodopirellula lusitana]|uniref:LamG-like jellyroll fold domain-containing protein n=1 Tax=Neorhodopirellula lusitana TaxID=445327 RepID=UPI00384DC475